MKTTLVVTAQLVVLFAISNAGYAVAAALNLPVPGNLLGMLFLLTLLATGVVRLPWVEASASLLIRHLAFFFIPITVGLMAFADVFLVDGAAILVTLTLSAAVGICVAGLTAQRLARRRRSAS